MQYKGELNVRRTKTELMVETRKQKMALKGLHRDIIRAKRKRLVR